MEHTEGKLHSHEDGQIHLLFAKDGKDGKVCDHICIANINEGLGSEEIKDYWINRIIQRDTGWDELVGICRDIKALDENDGFQNNYLQHILVKKAKKVLDAERQE